MKGYFRMKREYYTHFVTNKSQGRNKDKGFRNWTDVECSPTIYGGHTNHERALNEMQWDNGEQKDTWIANFLFTVGQQLEPNANLDFVKVRMEVSGWIDIFK